MQFSSSLFLKSWIFWPLMLFLALLLPWVELGRKILPAGVVSCGRKFLKDHRTLSYIYGNPFYFRKGISPRAAQTTSVVFETMSHSDVSLQKQHGGQNRMMTQVLIRGQTPGQLASIKFPNLLPRSWEQILLQ